MFRRMTPPRSNSRLDQQHSPSLTSVGSATEYSENGPELENAIMNKNWSLVRKYVPQGLGMARKNLLHKAVRAGAPVEIIEMMVEKGCNVEETQEGNWTPLHIATKYDAAPAVIEFLIKSGARVNIMTSTGESPLFFAAERDADAAVDVLIKGGADVNQARSTDGMTPLMVVVHNHASPSEAIPWVLQLLLKAEADVNIASNDGSTPLTIAASKGCSSELLTILIKAGADVNRAKKSGETPLISLVQNDAAPAQVSLLLQAGADVNRPNAVGETPILLAAQKNVHPALMETLIKAGGDVNKPSSSGLTPIFGAVLAGSSQELVKIMIQYGADIVSHRFQRKTVLEVAKDRGFTHLFDLLDPANKVAPVEFSRVNFPFSFCAMCRSSEKALTPCSTCNLVAYCSDDCKARHWKVGGHKEICTAVLSHMGEDDEEE